MKPAVEWPEAYDRIRAHLANGESHASRAIDLVALGLDEKSPEVAKALAFLGSEGVIVARRGKFYTASKPARSSRRTSFFSDYQRARRIPSVKTLSLDIVPVDDLEEELIGLFRLSNTELVIRHYHIQQIDAVPYALALSYLPHDIFGSLYSRLENSGTDLYHMMAEVGYRPTKKRETLYVDAPTQDERKLLALDGLDRVMIMRIDGVVSAGDRIVEVCKLCDRADLYEFTYEVPLIVPPC
jgi:DNA-binding GntR family transcriptional regulator